MVRAARLTRSRSGPAPVAARPALAGLAGLVVLAACRGMAPDDGARPAAAAPGGARGGWAQAIQDVGRYPVLPPSGDVGVGDVFLLSEPPEPGGAGVADALAARAHARWTTLAAPALEESLRAGTVSLRPGASIAVESEGLGAFPALELAPLLEAGERPEDLDLSLQVADARTVGVPVDELLAQLLLPADPAGAGRPLLAPRHRQDLGLAANPATGRAYLVVVSEAMLLREADLLVRRRGAAGSGGVLDGESARAAARRARELNATLAGSARADRVDGAFEFVAVTDDALTVRRTWNAPLAIGVRGLTLEVDVATGEVLRSAPIGVELPPFEIVDVAEQKGEESEVLEERRRGAARRVRTLEELRETRLYWDYGPRLDTLGGDLTLVLGGRLHLDAAAFSEDDDIVAAFGDPDPGLNVRRAFLELGGVYKELDFNLWLNLSDVDLIGDESLNFDYANFRNVFVGVRNVPGVGGIRAGYFKEPFGLEETTSSNDITFMERSLTDAFVERRNLGVMLTRRFTEDRRMTAALGFYRNANDNLDVSDGYGLTGRVTGAPILADDGRRVLHVGGSTTVRVPDDDGLRFFQRPESGQAQVLADTGLFDADRDVRVGLELGAVMDSLSLQSEAIVAAVDGGSGVADSSFFAAYLMGSYVLTGEHRSYRARVGAFGTVVPDRPLGQGGAGALELATRYSYLDLDSGDVDGGALHDWTLGMNWYLNGNVRFMVNYVAAHPEGFDVEHIVQARLQLTF